MGTVVIDSVVPYPRRLGLCQIDSFLGPQGWPAHRSAEWPLVPEPGLVWEVILELVSLGSRPLPGVWKLGLCWRDSSMTHSVRCISFQIKPCLGGFPEATAPVGGGWPLEPSPRVGARVQPQAMASVCSRRVSSGPEATATQPVLTSTSGGDTVPGKASLSPRLVSMNRDASGLWFLSSGQTLGSRFLASGIARPKGFLNSCQHQGKESAVGLTPEFIT